MNKQPFYHSVQILFTATEEIDEKLIRARVRHGFAGTKAVYINSVEVECLSVEPGDPADLVE